MFLFLTGESADPCYCFAADVMSECFSLLQLATFSQVSPGVDPRNLSHVPEVDEISPSLWPGNGSLCIKISETADLVELKQSLNSGC